MQSNDDIFNVISCTCRVTCAVMLTSLFYEKKWKYFLTVFHIHKNHIVVVVVARKRAENNLTVLKHVAGNITKENHRRRRTQNTCNLLTGDMWLSLKMLLAALACMRALRQDKREKRVEGRSERRNIVVSLKLWYSRPKKCLLCASHLTKKPSVWSSGHVRNNLFVRVWLIG